MNLIDYLRGIEFQEWFRMTSGLCRTSKYQLKEQLQFLTFPLIKLCVFYIRLQCYKYIITSIWFITILSRLSCCCFLVIAQIAAIFTSSNQVYESLIIVSMTFGIQYIVYSDFQFVITTTFILLLANPPNL